MTSTPEVEGAVPIEPEEEPLLDADGAVDPSGNASVADPAETGTGAQEVRPTPVPEEEIPLFLSAEAVARAALAEIAPIGSIGALVRHEATDDGAVLLQFSCLTKAYTGWLWTAALGRAGDDAAPTVLEVELLPGDGALTSPAWRPWEERYAEYMAAHPEIAGSEDGADQDPAAGEDAPVSPEGDVSQEASSPAPVAPAPEPDEEGAQQAAAPAPRRSRARSGAKKAVASDPAGSEGIGGKSPESSRQDARDRSETEEEPGRIAKTPARRRRASRPAVPAGEPEAGEAAGQAAAPAEDPVRGENPTGERGEETDGGAGTGDASA